MTKIIIILFFSCVLSHLGFTNGTYRACTLVSQETIFLKMKFMENCIRAER